MRLQILGALFEDGLTCRFLLQINLALGFAQSRIVIFQILPRGGETILLCEDDESVRFLAQRVLENCGYIVLEAGDGEEALRLADAHPGAIHLLVSDVVMPHLGGRALADRLLLSRPHVKILFLSGYTNDAVMRHGVLDADFAFLQKPFTTSTLAQKVRQVLEQEPS